MPKQRTRAYPDQRIERDQAIAETHPSAKSQGAQIPKQRQNATVVQMSADLLQQLLTGMQTQMQSQMLQMHQDVMVDVRNHRGDTLVVNFIKCTYHFSGNFSDDVTALKDTVETCRDCAAVSDQNALR